MKDAEAERDAIRYETMNSMMKLLKNAENQMIDVINCVRDAKNSILDDFQNQERKNQ